MAKEIQYYFTIQAYERRNDDGNIYDSVTMEILDTNAESAMKRAKKLIKKNGYRFSSVVQKTDEKHEV